MEPTSVIDQEASATLDEVLAFIDAWEGDGATLLPDQAPQAKSNSRSHVGHEIKRLRRETKYLELRLQQ